MINYNFHAHTTRCQHATGTEREYIESAIEIGMKNFGFSDHCPIPFKSDYVSHIRMKMDEAEEYVNCIRKLSEEYKNDIKIYVGFECEYVREFFDEQMSFFDKLGVDYLIMGEHFLESEETGVYSGTPYRDEAYLKNYVDMVIEGMQTGRFLYVAHPDIVNYIADKNLYKKELRRLCIEAKRLNIPLEVNALGYVENKQYPNPLFWEVAGEVGVKGVIGMDAHDPLMVKNQAAHDACRAILDKYKIEETEPVLH